VVDFLRHKWHILKKKIKNMPFVRVESRRKMNSFSKKIV
jgi:hypothetical protein